MKTIMVIGAGQMGGGIAQVAAQAGYIVILNDMKEEYVNRGITIINKNQDLGISTVLVPCSAKYVKAGWLGRKTGRGFYQY